VIANFVGLAGHVHIGDWAVIGGLSGVHQFCKVGAHAMIGFSRAVSQDGPPFIMVDGNPLAVRGCNLEGLRRRGFDVQRIGVVKQMHRLLYRQKLTLEQARESIAKLAAEVPAAAADVALMTGFLAQAGRGIAR
jgi:UDP-N-acetylglucosamine acyltransferase